jgi:hypothetical protein
MSCTFLATTIVRNGYGWANLALCNAWMASLFLRIREKLANAGTVGYMSFKFLIVR